MTKNTLANLLILGLAVIGAIVILPWLFGLLFVGTFSLIGLLIMMVLWMFAGALAGRLLRGEGYGVVGDIALGFVGGLIGTRLLYLFGLGGLVQIPFLGPIIAGAIGAIIFVYVVRLFDRNFAR